MATRGVFAAILRQEKDDWPEILLIQRAGKPDKTGYPKQWELPGGRVEEGETDEQCVMREVLEETGLQVKSLGVVSPELTAPAGVVTAQSDEAVVHFCEIVGGELKSFPTNDHLDAQWFTVDDLFSDEEVKVLTNPTSRGYVSRMMKMILSSFHAHDLRHK